MLSYRHAFHAGNHADMLKHFILFLTLSYFNRKDKPYWYIDTHSGAGLYRLTDDTAQKTGEHQQGIGRLLAAPALPAELEQFRQHLRHILPAPDFYCGSPRLAQSLLRDSDKIRLFELHSADFALLQENTRADRRIIAKQSDGYQGLISLLPPPTRRALILIAKKAANCLPNCANCPLPIGCKPNCMPMPRAATASACTAAACSLSIRPIYWPNSSPPTCLPSPNSWRKTEVQDLCWSKKALKHLSFR